MILCPQFLYVSKAKLVKLVFVCYLIHIFWKLFIWVLFNYFVVSRKRYVSAFTISTKGKMSLLGLCVLLILKSKLWYFYCVLHYIYLFLRTYIHLFSLTILLCCGQKTWICVHYWSQMRSGDTWPAWTIGPKGEVRTLSPRVPFVLKVKQDFLRGYAFGSKWKTRTICLCVPFVQKVNIWYLDCVRYLVLFSENYIYWFGLNYPPF